MRTSIDRVHLTHPQRTFVPFVFYYFLSYTYIYVLLLEERIELLTKYVILLFISILRFEIHIELQIHLFLAINLRIHDNKNPMHIKHPPKQILQQGILRLYNL